MRGVIIAALVVGSIVAGGVVSAANHSVSVDGAIDVPNRTVDFAGETYQVSSIGRVSHGEPLRAHTTGGEGSGYRVYIHDVDGTVVDQRYAPSDGDGSVSFNTSTFETGSYVLSVYHDGTYYDPHPVVVQASDVEISVPTRVETAETIAIPVTVTPPESGQPIGQVTVVVTTANTTRRYDAARDGDKYIAELDDRELPAGTYAVYAAVTNAEGAPGPTNELIALSDTETLDLVANQNKTGSTPADTRTGAQGGSPKGDAGTAVAPDAVPGENDTGTPTSTASAQSEDTVISPESSEDDATSGGVSNDEAGGIPFALVSLLAVVGLLALRGPAERE